MKVYRYMSDNEYHLMLAGMDIVGKTQFEAKTTSSGVCFLPEQIRTTNEWNRETIYSPEEAYRHMAGIVSDERLVEFEVNPGMEHLFQESKGEYMDYDDYDDYNDSSMSAAELCTPKYHLGMVTPTRVTKPSSDINEIKQGWQSITVTGKEREGYVAERDAMAYAERFGIIDDVYGEKGGRLPMKPGQQQTPRNHNRPVNDMPTSQTPSLDINAIQRGTSARNTGNMGMSNNNIPGSSRSIEF